MAEREGFEPSVPFGYIRFPVVHLRPLGHLSKGARSTRALSQCLARILASLRSLTAVAEREGFEPPIPSRVYLISSQAPSASLGHLSTRQDLWRARLRALERPPGSNPRSALGRHDSRTSKNVLARASSLLRSGSLLQGTPSCRAPSYQAPSYQLPTCYTAVEAFRRRRRSTKKSLSMRPSSSSSTPLVTATRWFSRVSRAMS